MAQLADDCFAFGGHLMTMAEALRLVDERTVAVTGTETVGLREGHGRTPSTSAQTLAAANNDRFYSPCPPASLACAADATQ